MGRRARARFRHPVDNVKIATQHLGNDRPGKFMEVEYPLPPALAAGKSKVTVKFVPHERSTAGPVFGVFVFKAAASAHATA